MNETNEQPHGTVEHPEYPNCDSSYAESYYRAPQLRAQERRVARRLARLVRELPPEIREAPLSEIIDTAGGYEVSTYSLAVERTAQENDTLELPEAQYPDVA